jgi:hypothetical protein
VAKKNHSIAQHKNVATTPDTPELGYSKIYPKSDSLWYYLDDQGIEHQFGLTALNFERRSDYVYPYHYSGNAVIGTIDSQNWTIYRIDYTTPGSPILETSVGPWTDRYILIYT